MTRLFFFFALAFLLLGVRIVNPNEWLVVFRSGKYSGFRKQGIHWVVPFLDKTVRVDLQEVSPKWAEMPQQILETEVHKRAAERLDS